jgi:type II secretion system (T2SS) protein C
MKVLSAFATLAAGCALALVIAYWGWHLFGPASVHLASPSPANPAATIIAANLFGTGKAASQASAGAALLSADTQLLGIIAERERGYALFRTSGGTKVVAQGEDIAPGVKLAAVKADEISVRDGAGEHSIALRTNTGGAPAQNATSASGAHAARAATASATCAPPAGFRGGIVRLNAELLGGLASDPSAWRALLASAPGGLVVQNDGGFGAMLGLRAGDRISQANGIALNVPDDVTSAVIRPLMANQGVRVVGSRGGAPQEVWLANVACAGNP